MPTAPAAPVLFTTPTGFFSTFSIAAATGRAVRSASPPGGNGATMVIGRSGYVSGGKASALSAKSKTSQIGDAMRPNRPSVADQQPKKKGQLSPRRTRSTG